VEVWNFANLFKYAEQVGGGNFRIVFHPDRGTALVRKKPVARLEYEFDCCCRLVWELAPITFVIDEAWLFTQPGWMPEPLNALGLMGRTRGVTLLYTAQRPQDIARRLTALTTSWEIFRVEEPADLAALPRSIPPEMYKQIPSLPDRVHLSRSEHSPWSLVKP
jgi:hypothetical protein